MKKYMQKKMLLHMKEMEIKISKGDMERNIFTKVNLGGGKHVLHRNL